MYVRDTDPLPCNLTQPTQAQMAYDAAVVQSMDQSVQNAYAASQSIAPPSSFAEFGAGVVVDVARAQNNMAAANRSADSIPSPSSVIAVRGPRVFALNVDQQEYSGCSRGGAVYSPARVQPPQPVRMPDRAPVPVVISPGGIAPKWDNLCVAFRNGLVTQDQFSPDEFAAMYQKCAELGYAGGCPTPPNVLIWQLQQRAAGTLPHIPVSQGLLASIPHAPDLGGKSCQQANALPGMSGYRGMGIWGDAGSNPTTYGWPRRSSSVNWSALLFLGALGVGLYVMKGKNGR
jgi:hypothetical protein